MENIRERKRGRERNDYKQKRNSIQLRRTSDLGLKKKYAQLLGRITAS